MESIQGLSKYEIEDNLGEGNYGNVYKALNKENKKYYALKEISQFDKNTIEEVKILSNFNHDNIIKYYDSFIHKDKIFKKEKLYIIMEYCENGDLRKFINNYKNKNEKISQNKIIRISLGICEGLKEIHSKNIIHRDLKPENIFISKDFKIKIGDFGISKNFEKSNQYAQSQKGTVRYMAPEMIKENARYNNKVDIWALGCIIYELCTLNYCFDGDGIGLFNQIINNEHGKINLKYYSSDLQTLIDLLLNKDYKKRPEIKDIYNRIKKLKNKISYTPNKVYKKREIKGIYNKRIKKLKNEISMIIEIKDEDINKNIFFLDNYCHRFYNSKTDEGLKELNEENVGLYIDDKKYKYKKYHKFSKAGVHKIILKLKIKIKDCHKMFFGCKNLTKIDLSSFNTSNVTNMNLMFSQCSKLTNIDLSSFDTSKVTKMRNMFNCCCNLTNLHLSSFNTSNVTDMTGMFSGCCNLTNLDLSSFNTSNVTNMKAMFNGCCRLTNLNLSSFNTSNVKDMRQLFGNCCCLTNLDLTSFKTSNVTSMNSMFYFCFNLNNINLSSFNTSNIASMFQMFRGCGKLTNLDLSSFNTSNVTNMDLMFYGCRGLNNINTNDSKLINALNYKFCN